jgi:hypothetical protein
VTDPRRFKTNSKAALSVAVTPRRRKVRATASSPVRAVPCVTLENGRRRRRWHIVVTRRHRYATAGEGFDYISAMPDVENGWVEWQAYEFGQCDPQPLWISKSKSF